MAVLMQDELQVVKFARGGKPVTLFDLERVERNGMRGPVFKEKNSLKITPPEPADVESSGSRRWDGARTVSQKHGNGSITARWRVSGDTPQEALDNVGAFLAAVRGSDSGRYIKWRPVGAEFPTYFDVRGPGRWTPDYSKIVFEQNYSIMVDATWPVAPLAELDRMDIFDDFDVPADAKVLYTNKVTNPRAALDLTGIGGGSAGTAQARITAGVPGGFATGVETTGTAVAAATGVVVSYGRSGAGTGTAAHPVVGGTRVAVRGVARVVSIGAGAITNLSLRVYWYTSTGAAASVASNTVEAQAGPVIGTDYDFEGFADVPADAAFGVPRILTSQTNPSTWVIRSSAMMMCEVDGDETVVPPYFDAWTDRSQAVGVEHLSETRLYDRGSLDDYEFTAGPSLLAAAGGVLRQSTTNPKTIFHVGRGYDYADAQHTVKVRIGADPLDIWNFQLVLKYIDDLNYVYVRTSTGSGVHLRQVVDGVDTAALSAGASAAWVAGQSIWIRGRMEGSVAVGEVWLTPPTPMGTPAGTAAASTVDPRFGGSLSSSPGMNFTNGLDSDHIIEEYEVQPFTYRNRLLPDVITPCGGIPGDDEAPALLDLHVTPSGGAAAPAWAMVGWWDVPRSWNRVWNGDFGVDTAGWTVAAADNTVAATTITRVADTQARSGFAAEVVTPATLNSGSSFKVYGRFRKGVTYTFDVDVWAPASVTALGMIVGVTGDASAGTTQALTVAKASRTTTWTPTADRDYAVVALRVGAATATTFRYSNVRVYDGTAPTLATQSDGRGAQPPVGIIEAESAATLTTWAQITDANYRKGTGIRATAAGAGTATAEWLVDPALLDTVDFSHGEIDIEVWARVEMASTLASPVLTLSTLPESGVAYGAQRYTGEFGATGKLVTDPSAGTGFRLVRLGTVTMHVDWDRPVRWRLKLAASWATGSTGSFGVDELLLAPIDKRAVSGPTGRPLDGSYPRFVQSTAETTKLIRADGSGMVGKPGQGMFPDVGMSRSLEIDSGRVELLLALSSLVPDDPTADASTEQEDYSATVHAAVVPRVHLVRGS